jgi:ABC-type amino acid transport substrate-binding protein/multisubunit Na+/H+ antiporter MnhG subunit
MQALKDIYQRLRATKTATKIWGVAGTLVAALVLFSAYSGLVDSWKMLRGSLESLTLLEWLIALVVFLLLLFTGAVWALVVVDRTHKRKIARALRTECSDTRERFEVIERDTLRLGWVNYYPTLIETPDSHDPIGVGPGILKRVFRNKVSFNEEQSSWDTIIDELVSDQFDVIATPLYDIRERRIFVEFTTPIFYADIGLFTAQSNVKVVEALGDRGLLSFEDARKALTPLDGQLRFCAHKGELQEKMKEKYFPNSSISYTSRERFSVRSALKALCNARGKHHSDLYFCERVVAERQPLFLEGRIINILRPGQLMFPVAFAVRKGDETLRKYINLRLMEIDSAKSSGIRDEIIKHTQVILADVPESRRGEFFLRNRIGLEPEMPISQEEVETPRVVSIKSEGRRDPP